MRVHLRVTLLVFLCLWIPVAHSQEGPEDQDASGDDAEISGSGSGDSILEDPNDDFELTTDTPNITITAEVPNIPFGLPEHPVTQSSSTVPPKVDPKTTELIILASVLPTTQRPATLLPTTIKSSIMFDLEEDPEAAQTTAVPEMTQTSVLSVDKLPVPTAEGAFTTTSFDEYVEEKTTAGFLVGQKQNDYQEETTARVLVGQKENDYQEETTARVLVGQTENDYQEETTAGVLVGQKENDYQEETTARILVGQTENDYQEETTAGVLVGQKENEGEPETTDVPVGTSAFSDVADPEASGDDVSMTTQAVLEGTFLEDNIIPHVNPDTKFQREDINDDDFSIDNEIGYRGRSGATVADNENLLERKEVLAGVIAGGVVGLAFAIMLVALMVYRMKKKDEGSYSLDEHKHPNGGYQKPQRQEEFLA